LSESTFAKGRQVMGYGADVGRSHAIHMSWIGGKVAGHDECNAEWISWAESKCPHLEIDTVEILRLECYQCWIELWAGDYNPILIAQDAKTMAALIALMDGICPHGYQGKSVTAIFTKRMCPRCWQELKESVKHE
jgi:hypothetical protein